jgi:2-polyprenyl-3-methyl-5-hydroxy-6-metoxy-1,4-benzoquinol methylase
MITMPAPPPPRAPLSAPLGVALLRERFAAHVRQTAPTDAARRWRVGRFERGLRLAGELERRCGSLLGRRVLDVGAAQGGDAAAFLAHGASVTCADLRDYGFAALGAALQAGPRLEHVCFNCNRPWPLPDASYDVVLALSVIEHVPDLDAFFGELLRVLRPGGLAVIETATAWKNARRDNLYGLPLVSLLPMTARRWVATRIFRRRYEFALSNRTFYGAAALRRIASRHGAAAQVEKYADSRLLRRVSGWPLPRAWQALVRELLFDFILVQRSTG